MASRLQSVTNAVINRPCRMILLGTDKIGKSSFAAGAPNVVFIPIKREEGVDDLAVDKFPVCQSFNDLMETLQELAEEDHKWKHVAIDSASTLEPLIWEHVAEVAGVDSIEKVGGGYGKGYAEALLCWFQIMDVLDYLREEKKMGSIIIGHSKVKRFDDPERESYDQYQFDLKETVAAALYRWADFTGFANTSVAIEKEKIGFNKEKKRAKLTDDGARFLYTKKTPAHPGGGRGVYGRLPEEIPLNWEDFDNEVKELTKQSSKAKAGAKAKE